MPRIFRWPGVYTALQTHLVDGQDNPYDVIENQRFYEVQKYLGVVDAMWSRLYFYCGGEAWNRTHRLAGDRGEARLGLRPAVVRRPHRFERLAGRRKLRRQGLTFNVINEQSFKSPASWYATARTFYGPALWNVLEKYSGKLS